MKKIVKAAFITALVCFASSAFAATPQSFLKETTFNLFEDEVVDNFAWGVEDADGIVLGGFNTFNDFNIGAGANIGPFWYSIFDQGYFNVADTITETKTSDAGKKGDEAFVDADSSKAHARGNLNLGNNLYFSLGNGDWGVQAYWSIYDWTGGSNPIGKNTWSTEDHANKTFSNGETNVSKFNGRNIFGANFHEFAINLDNDVDMYFQLNNFNLNWYRNYSKTESKTVTKTDNGNNGYDVSTKTTTSLSSTNWIYPSVNGEMGFSLPSVGGLSTDFVLVENLWLGFAINKNESSTTTDTDTQFSKSTNTNKTVNTWDAGFRWSNTLTPKFNFDFDVGERLSVKAYAALGIGLNNQDANGNYVSSKNYTTESVSSSSSRNKTANTSTSNYQKSISCNSADNKDYFTFELVPDTAIALVYQVKPQKLNLNCGFEWNNGSLKWTTTTTTSVDGKSSYYYETVAADGTKTVLSDGKVQTIKADDPDSTGDGKTNKKETVFNASLAWTPTFKLGVTWFINEKASLDIAYQNSFNSLAIMGNGSLLESALKLMLSVRF